MRHGTLFLFASSLDYKEPREVSEGKAATEFSMASSRSIAQPERHGLTSMCTTMTLSISRTAYLDCILEEREREKDWTSSFFWKQSASLNGYSRVQIGAR